MNTYQASITRVHDAMLGGTDHYAADKAVRDRLVAIDPDFPLAARETRAFLSRAVRYLVGEAGLTQLLDCGLALPLVDDTHRVAHLVNPECVVVYVSVDQFALTHARRLLDDNDRAHVSEVNLSHAYRVLSDPIVTKYLDFTKPLGLLQVLSLHHVPDHDDPWLTMQRYVDALAPGSHVVLIHFLDPGEGHELADTMAKVSEVYRAGVGTGWPRSAERIRDLLPGLDLLEPGLVPVGDWRPDAPRTGPLGAMQRLVMGAVARKP
ncbi:SAM-dependent methyltransferase [Kibdelosporangium philippinense]|uniref:SAM-dependent methyltransferase n=1 Tax=Kibdelosporangium philippinense TaxID=211113 RepID=A0ABS8ZWB3_9PSEU|nr:SAM-dependent methyltransferase [Kibdelosporangium philippinense]MCE7010137.1 SAM-dependent methyltransferase [Kibdelosporangium philippinense]